MANTLLERLQRHVPDVKRVRDAKRGIKIEVTDKDCLKYGQKTYQSCAIALAAKRFKLFTDAVVTRRMAYLVRGTTAYRFSVTPRTSRELREFDKSGDFTPGIYSLTTPSHLIGAAHSPKAPNINRKPRGEVQHLRQGVRRIGP